MILDSKILCSKGQKNLLQACRRFIYFKPANYMRKLLCSGSFHITLQCTDQFFHYDRLGQKSIHTTFQCLLSVFVKSIGSHCKDPDLCQCRILQCPLENSGALLEEIDTLITHIHEYRDAIAEGDSERLYKLLDHGRRIKEALDHEND